MRNARLLAACASLGLAFCASSGALAALPGSATTTLGMLVLSQRGEPSESENRRAADNWLQLARQAMDNGDFNLAERYVERAEQLNVEYDPLFARFKDTPEKIRADIATMRAAGETGAAADAGVPGGQVPSDPFRRQNPAGGNVSDNGGSAYPLTGSAGVNPEAGPAAQLATWMQEARQSLARGDIDGAARLAGRASQLGVPATAHGDSPARLQALITQARRFAQGPPAGGNEAEMTREYAQFLLDQSEGLALYGDWEGAERMARSAAQLPARYSEFERTPDQVLQRIASARSTPAGTSHGTVTDGPPRRLPGSGTTVSDAGRTEALRLVAMAKAALDRGDLAGAEQLAQQAHQLRVPDEQFAANDMRPWEVLLEISKVRNQRGVAVAGFAGPAVGGNEGGAFPVAPGVYRPGEDTTRTLAAQATQPTPAVPPATEPSAGVRLYQEGLEALRNQDLVTAQARFREAWQYEGELDPVTRQQLQDKLNLLRAAAPPATGQEPSPLDVVDAQQQLLRQALYREITSERAEAERQASVDPRGALTRLERLRERVNESEVDPAAKQQLLSMVDRGITSLEQFIEQYRSDIELAERNREVLEGVELSAARRDEVRAKIAELVEDFNDLMDEHRYAEAEVLAKQARELDPESDVVQNLLWKSRFARRYHEQMMIEEEKEQGFYDQITAVDHSSIPFDDRNPIVFADATEWRRVSQGRRDWLEQQRRQVGPEEMEIYRSMKNKVDVNFTDRPLSEVMDVLSSLSGVPIVLDPQGLAAEGVTSDTPVTMRLNQQISLQSALNLILEPLRLSFVVQNEVLRITSEQTRDSNVFPRVYNVADLVIPIPNFIPGYNIGLPGAIQAAHNALGYGGAPYAGQPLPLTVASNQQAPGAMNASVLAQMGASGMIGSMSSPPQPMGFGPGGMGGAALADFDTLIELITSTIAPDSWDEVGGPGAIEPFPTNLSLVISQTQDVHEQIADLLEQLRRLQDLQVTIEVRFITLNDDFFERIGIDFDFDIDDNVNVDVITDDGSPTLSIGLDEMGPTVDLDIPFTQDSFGSTVPQFGGFDASTAANFGFAILSDIEVFFLLQAAEGDRRSNVLQAPKVTLFNGQTASVNDVSQQPFVTSIIPIVGDFAAAHQPVIVVLSEGTSMSVQAVVSPDRRFVRLTLVPFFSRIGPVDEFTFDGRTTTDTGSIVTDPDGEEQGRNNQIAVTEGTTVQLPTFIFTTVSTTVSVPDGGTVLLGGIKRLSEGRDERGVPMLSKLPYVNRLFKNVGIGRQTQSLMMMVTPRIIIQEEEEFAQTGYRREQ